MRKNAPFKKEIENHYFLVENDLNVTKPNNVNDVGKKTAKKESCRDRRNLKETVAENESEPEPEFEPERDPEFEPEFEPECDLEFEPELMESLYMIEINRKSEIMELKMTTQNLIDVLDRQERDNVESEQMIERMSKELDHIKARKKSQVPFDFVVWLDLNEIMFGFCFVMI